MSSPEASKPLQLTLKISGGWLPVIREISVNDQTLTDDTYQIGRKDTKNPPASILLSPATRADITDLVETIHKEKLQPEKTSPEISPDGNRYELQVQDPVKFTLQIINIPQASETFHRLTDKLKSASRPPKQPS